MILATVENAKRSLELGCENLSGTLKIGVPSLVAGYFLGDMLPRFRAAYHIVTTQLVEDDRPYIEP